MFSSPFPHLYPRHSHWQHPHPPFIQGTRPWFYFRLCTFSLFLLSEVLSLRHLKRCKNTFISISSVKKQTHFAFSDLSFLITAFHLLSGPPLFHFNLPIPLFSSLSLFWPCNAPTKNPYIGIKSTSVPPHGLAVSQPASLSILLCWCIPARDLQLHPLHLSPTFSNNFAFLYLLSLSMLLLSLPSLCSIPCVKSDCKLLGTQEPGALTALCKIKGLCCPLSLAKVAFELQHTEWTKSALCGSFWEQQQLLPKGSFPTHIFPPSDSLPILEVESGDTVHMTQQHCLEAWLSMFRRLWVNCRGLITPVFMGVPTCMQFTR